MGPCNIRRGILGASQFAFGWGMPELHRTSVLHREGPHKGKEGKVKEGVSCTRVLEGRGKWPELRLIAEDEG